MSLLDFFRRKKKAAPPAPTLREIWQGFQQVLAGNNEALVMIEDLEEKLSVPGGLDFRSLGSRVEVLDRLFVDLVGALRRMSGGRWPELEAARLRIQSAIHRRLEEGPRVPPSPLLVRLEEAGPELYGALGARPAIWPGSRMN